MSRRLRRTRGCFGSTKTVGGPFFCLTDTGVAGAPGGALPRRLARLHARGLGHRRGRQGPRRHRGPRPRRRIAHRDHRRCAPACGGRIRGAGQWDLGASAGLRRHLQPGPHHDPWQRAAVARNPRRRGTGARHGRGRDRRVRRGLRGPDASGGGGRPGTLRRRLARHRKRSGTSAPPSRRRGCSGCLPSRPSPLWVPAPPRVRA